MTRPTITTDWLRKHKACPEGITYFETLQETDALTVFGTMIDRQQNLSWANWAIARLMTKPQAVAYAIYATEQVIGIYEQRYPTDQRPRNAIDAVKAYLKNPTNAAVHAAYAADAAYAAADAKTTTQITILEYGLRLIAGEI